MTKPVNDEEDGIPDDESPEWTDEDTLWSVKGADFGGFMAAMKFLQSRAAFLKAAEAAGIERAAFLPFDPSKPGFEERARKAFETFLNATRHAAE